MSRMHILWKTTNDLNIDIGDAFWFQVDRTPLPLLFMRTVIQAIDAYPTLVSVIPIELRQRLKDQKLFIKTESK